jgi:nucleoside-diphosphate-sugar epimerase
LYVSSQAAAGVGTASKPASEDGPAVPVTEYGRSKLAAEQIVKESASLPWTIVRPASVYGSRDRQFLPLFRLAARGLFPLMTEPSAAYTLLHVEDLVRAIVLAATDTRAAAQTFFVGHRDVATPDALWRALAGAFDRAYRPRRIPWPVMQGLASVGELWWMLGRQPLIDRARLTELRAPGFVCLSEHIRRTLGFEAAVGLEEGVRGTARWYRENGWV